MRGSGSNFCDINEHRIYYSGTTNGKHEYGVGVIINKTIAKYVPNFIPISERTMLLQIQTTPANINVIQVYAPTCQNDEDEIKEFYYQIIEVLKELPKQDLTIIMGDWNAKIRKGRVGDIIGPHVHGERNERGDLLNLFAEEQDLIVTNTWFKLPDRRLYTWKAPRDKHGDITRHQINHILVNKRFGNSCKSMKTYPGADIQSDHNPLVGVFRVKLKNLKRKIVKQHNFRKLKEPLIKEQVRVCLNKEIN
uniref:Endonuclease/exonuclease/phosphatase domain-containing protein n=1 Tax=Dendroctonus ponderosae TaxID=77166 RepID=A0AAR5PA30_DENPD